VLAAGFFTGCSEEVTPVLGTEMAYSIYGLFTPELDTQWVRVFPIEGTLQLREATPLDAIVTSTDLHTGEELVWQDSLLLQPNGGYEHAFWAPFSAAYGHEYRLDVRRSDGLTTSGQAAVPSLLDTEIQPFEERPDVVIPVMLRGSAGYLMKAEVEYDVIYDYFEGPPSSVSSDKIVLPYDGALSESAEGWLLPINLSDDYDRMKTILTQEMRWNPGFRLVILGMSARMLVASEDWTPPGGVFDPEVLGMPNVMSNVDNGFGLVVGGYHLGFGIFPSDEAVSAAGFRLLSEVGE
jgi:hypothetical protein